MNSTRRASTKWTEDELNVMAETALAVAQATISNAILDAGISQAELSRRIGSSRAYITRMLQGDYNLSVKSLARVLAACGRQLHVEATLPQCTWAAQSPRIATSFPEAEPEGEELCLAA